MLSSVLYFLLPQVSFPPLSRRTTAVTEWGGVEGDFMPGGLEYTALNFVFWDSLDRLFPPKAQINAFSVP